MNTHCWAFRPLHSSFWSWSTNFVADVGMLIQNEELYDTFPNVSIAVRMFTVFNGLQLFGRAFIHSVEWH